MLKDEHGYIDWSEYGQGSLRTFKENVNKRFGVKDENTEEELCDVLTSISSHLQKEHSYHVTNSIGRGHVKFKDGVSDIWITNVTPNQAYKDLTKNGENVLGVMVPKNFKLGKTIAHNYEGHFSVHAPGGIYSFDILNSSTYIPTYSNDAERVRVGFHGQGFVPPVNLQEALRSLQQTEKLAKAKRKELDDKIAEEELNRKRAKEEALIRAEELRKAKDEEERRRLEEELRLKEELQRQKEEAARIELQRLAEETDELNNKLQEEQERYAHAAKFIRKQASLRLNPVLDIVQEDIKFSNLYNGVVTVIDGGPGTGKTTTLIQRLRLLICEDDLKDYIENNPSFSLSQNQFDAIGKNGGDWIFFSPTELLKQYMKENMNYEGLTNTTTKVVVWNDYLRKILRDDYKLVGEKKPFSFKIREHEGTILIKNNEISVLEGFLSFFVETVKKEISRLSQIELSRFPSWNFFGQMIVSECSSIENCTSIRDVIRLLVSLNELCRIELPNQYKNGEQLAKDYSSHINQLAIEQMAILKRDEELFRTLLSWIDKELYGEEEPEDDTELDSDIEDIDFEDEDFQDHENELLKRIKGLLRAMAISLSEKIQLNKKQTELKDIIGDKINTEPLAQLGEYAYYYKRVHPVINNLELFIMSLISKYYKTYRKDCLKNIDPYTWNEDLLRTIVVKQKNKPLHPQEQSLLLGFINNLIGEIRQISPTTYNDLNHKYSVGYKKCCKTVIGIDEATDYCVLDYYAISSLRNHEISAITMTGDSMQCLRSNGIMNWHVLKNKYIFPELEVKELQTSYRQSPELLKLAHSLYKNTIGTDAPYNCHEDLINEIVPKPLWYESDDESKKAKWIVERILEVKRSYGMVPSIAIFVNNREEARELENAILDIDKLEAAGIKVADCSGGDKMATTDTVRIFPLNSVKGMEFEVAFFYNIDKIQELVERYLYVGLSRATFYLGVVTNENSDTQLDSIKKLFVQNGDWRHINNEN